MAAFVLKRVAWAFVLAFLISFVTFDAFAFPMCAAMTFLVLGCAGAAWRIAGQPDPLAVAHA